MVEIGTTWTIDSEFSIRAMSKEDFYPLMQKHSEAIFDSKSPIFRIREALSESEREKIAGLRESMGEPIEVRLGLFHGSEFVGWNYTRQESGFTAYMQNSAVFAEYRRRGLYSALAQRAIAVCVERGFQTIYSRHDVVNNDIIIAKLKLGFKITSFELSDVFGVLVHLSYFPNPTRQKMLDFRAGYIRPDDEIKGYLKI